MHFYTLTFFPTNAVHKYTGLSAMWYEALVPATNTLAARQQLANNTSRPTDEARIVFLYSILNYYICMP